MRGRGRKLPLEVRELVLLCLLNWLGRRGRYYLVGQTSLGEGEVRYTLARLRDRGLVESSRGGTAITDEGREYLRRVLEGVGISMVGREDLEWLVGKKHAVVVVYEGGLEENVLDVRDRAVRYGASGAIILKVEERRVTMPPDERDISAYLPKLSRLVRERYLEGGGRERTIVMAFADRLGDALCGALCSILMAQTLHNVSM